MRQGDSGGGDAITVMDWIVSAALLFCHHCPPHYLSLTVRLPLSSTTNPGLSLFSHLPAAPDSLRSVLYCLELTSSLPHVHSGTGFIFLWWPFITVHLLKSIHGPLIGFLGELRLDQVCIDLLSVHFPWKIFPHVFSTHVKSH